MGGYFVAISPRSFIASIGVACLSIAISNNQFLRASELEFAGNASFSATSLSQTLESIPEYYFYAYVNPEPTKELELAEQLLTNGYRLAGFPDAQVKAVWANNEGHSGSRMKVAIEEGPQFRNGHVQVSGVDDAMAARIVERIESPYPSGEAFPTFVNVDGIDHCQWKSLGGTDAYLESPIWEQGKLTDFFVDNEVVESAVSDAMLNLGYSGIKFETSIVKVSEEQLTHLHIHVSDIGVAKQAEYIRILGVGDEEYNDVLSYLQLKAGDRIDTARIQEIYRLLWECGRFVNYQAVWESGQQNMLTIQLEKVSNAPWISQPLDEKGQVLLRCQKWLAGAFLRGEEISIESGNHLSKAIICEKGYYVELPMPNKQNNDDDTSERLQIVYNSEGTHINRSSYGEVITIPRDYLEIQASLSLGIKAPTAFELPGESQTESSIFNGRYDYQFQSAGGRYRYFDRIGFKANPAAILPLAYRKDVDSRFIESNLEINCNQMQVLIESSTGRVVSFKDNDVEIHFGTGMYDHAVAEILAKPDSFIADKPISSLLKFARDIRLWEVYMQPSPGEPAKLDSDPHLYRALAKIAGMDEFGPVEDILKEYLNHGKSTSGFRIPTKKLSGFWKNIAIRSLRATGLFERDSWPAKVALLNAMLIMERSDEVDSILDEVQNNPQSGPTCYVMITRVLWLHAHPRTRAFAKAARIARESDKSDKEWLVITSLLPQHSSNDILNTIHNLSSKEIKAVKRMIYGHDYLSKLLRMILESDPSETANLSHILHEASAEADYTFLLNLKKSAEEVPPPKKQERKMSDAWDLRSASSDIKVTK